jgi:hypothetical protein
MSTLLARQALFVAAATMLGASPAYADIYTWVDATGALNVSNLTPPDGARVIKVVHTSDETSASRADTQALADRVRQLEEQVDMARQQPPAYMPPPVPPVVYAPPAPPVFQYIYAPQPPVEQYANEAPPANPWCDTNWSDCGYGNGWWPYYPGVFVVTAPNFNRFKPGHNFPNFPNRPRPHPVTPATSLIQPLTTPIVQPLVGTQGSSFVQTPRMQGFHRG